MKSYCRPKTLQGWKEDFSCDNNFLKNAIANDVMGNKALIEDEMIFLKSS